MAPLPTDPSLWKDLALHGVGTIIGTREDAVQIVRQALNHKRERATGTILLLDAAHIGAILCPSLVKSYFAVFGDPEIEFSLNEVWIVGPTVRSTIRLGRSPI